MDRQQRLAEAFKGVRRQTLALIDGLTPEDCMVQSMADASPVKWHIAHVTWYFETFVLEPALGRDFRPFHPAFRVLFNSYYNGIGAFHPRPERGVLSRPSHAEVLAYRRAVDERIAALLAANPLSAAILDVIELGIHHEQQHQELILTDLKHHFSRNPLLPAYRPPAPRRREAPQPMRFVDFAGGRGDIGHDGRGFAFDNERPRHGVWLEPFALADRLVSVGEYAEFIADGGYRRAELWLSDGWDQVRRDAWQAPLYWRECDGELSLFSLSGERPLDPAEPVCHVSYYEADAYARWSGARLPSEGEWEHAATGAGISGNFLEDGRGHPAAAPAGDGLRQLFGDCWEWTASAYLPYPGYRPPAGPVGEYNGKFMVNQMVLRGGSCATPASHIRPSYRNFFPAGARWQFSGIRLAKEVGA